MYGDNDNKKHGISTEDDAYTNFEEICKSYDLRIEHLSKENEFDIDVKIILNNGKEVFVDIKSPGRDNYGSPNLAISYAENNNLTGKIHYYIDGNMLKEKNFNEKCVARCNQPHVYEDPSGKYYLLKKTLTLIEILNRIKKLDV